MNIEHVIHLLEYYGCIDDEIKLQAQEIRDAEEILLSFRREHGRNAAR